MLRAKIEKLKDEYSISTNPEVGSNSKNTNFANESESTKKYSEEEVENGIKQAVMTIHLAYSELFNNGVEDDEKLRIAEQCVAHISNEVSLWYTRFAGDSNGTPTVDENDESYSTNVELRRTVELHYQASQTIIPSIPQIQLCLTELQARVVDTVTDGGLKEKRRGVNKRIDEVVGKLDGYKNFVVVVDKLKSRN
ncbi:hypothetical protein HK098_000128 [Nowakowskiella sp. JEL0407]|nr:hypothetical protein HK098_000128 [Nowakowskiella sp. JEL0407]